MGTHLAQTHPRCRGDCVCRPVSIPRVLSGVQSDAEEAFQENEV